MAIGYRIDSKRRIVFTTASGTLTDDQLLEHKRTLINDPQFKAGMKEISDVRAVERLEITPEGVRKFAALDGAHADRLGDYRLAIIVSSDVGFGMARMYQMLTEASVEHVGVFREPGEAREWLGIEST